jgi:hypothetical protein
LARRGYLDRLVDDVATRRGRAARAPRQILWGPTRPAAPAADDETGAAELARPATRPTPRRSADHAPQPVAPQPGTPEPSPFPASFPLRVVTDPAPVRQLPGTPPARPAERRQPPVRPERPQDRPAVPARPAPTNRAGHQHQPGRPVPGAPVPAQPPAASPTQLPAAVTDALARLSALSNRTLPAAQPHPTRSPVPASPTPLPAPARAATPSAPPAAVSPGRPPREQPTRAPQVHIGSIEVTIAAAAPPAPAPPPIPQPAPVAAAPAGRLSRPVAPFGLGQG